MSTQAQRCIAQIREAIAEDPRTHSMDLDVRLRRGTIVLWGPCSTQDRLDAAAEVAGAVCPEIEVVNELWVADYRPVRTRCEDGHLRIGAVGDVHVSRDTEGLLRLRLTAIAEQADVLLLAGDLTQHGHLDEARVLAADLADLPVPIVAVLGNHDYHQGQEDQICDVLDEAGIMVLEADTVVIPVGGRRIGIAGVKGFGGGFAGACASEFGEPEMKDFVRHTKRQAQRLRDALCSLDADVRIALTHYSPVPDTLAGEPREIYPFLGSYLLGEAIDAGDCDLALHGHAHKGTELGVTAGGVPVRNVARPVIREAYRVYQLDGEPKTVSRAEPVLAAVG